MAVAASAAVSAKSVVESINSLGYITRPIATIPSESRGSERGITLTQLTNISTTVNANTSFPQGLKAGKIVTVATDFPPGDSEQFTLTNAAIDATSIVKVGIASSSWPVDSIPSASIVSSAAGTCDIKIGNGGDTTSGAVALSLWFEIA
jgi:hypothetical protein